jgi:copper chaperone CopZ
VHTIEGMPVVSETMHLTGIRCERCVVRLRGALGRLDGIEAARANLMGEVALTWDAERVDRAAIAAALAQAGFILERRP